MPLETLKSFAEKSGITIQKAEEYWKSAKKFVSEHFGLSPEKDKDKYWKAVVGTLKHWIRAKLPESDYLKEQVEDLLKQRKPELIQEFSCPTYEFEIPIPLLKVPDSLYYNQPVFEIENEEEFNQIVELKNKTGYWRDLVFDPEVRIWADLYPYKSFYFRHGGIFIKIR